MSYPTHSDEIVSKARRLHAQGHDANDIAEFLEAQSVIVSPDCVRNWLKGRSRTGKALSPPPPTNQEWPKWKDLAELAGCSTHALISRVRKGKTLEQAMKP